MTKQLSISERIGFVFIALFAMPVLCIIMYPVLVLGAVYVAIVGHYEKNEAGQS